MEITCPNCNHRFNWEPPGYVTVIKHIAADINPEEITSTSKTYTATCPNCKGRLEITA